MIRVTFRIAFIQALIENNLMCKHPFSIASSYVQNGQAVFISKLPKIAGARNIIKGGQAPVLHGNVR
jgi:hypothetical protein